MRALKAAMLAVVVLAPTPALAFTKTVPDYNWVTIHPYQKKEQRVATNWLVVGRTAASKGVNMPTKGSAGTTSFLSDRGGGAAKTALSGSTNRTVIGANQVKASSASAAKSASTGGNISLTPSTAKATEQVASTITTLAKQASSVGSATTQALSSSQPSDWVGTWAQEGATLRVVIAQGGNGLTYKIQQASGSSWSDATAAAPLEFSGGSLNGNGAIAFKGALVQSEGKVKLASTLSTSGSAVSFLQSKQ